MAQKIDLLKRTDFINRIVSLVEATSNNKGHRTFAIDGEWGSGKTWVLEEIEKVLSAKTTDDEKYKFLVVHYNCWEYDYYEEPLLAIVSALLNFIDNTQVLKSKAKGAAKRAFSQIGKKLISLGSAAARTAIGIDIEQTVKKAASIAGEIKKEAQDKYSFDNFYKFKETILSLRQELSKLSEKYSIVVFVDELDRCLPEYAIKVLERLHHIFDNINNLQVVFSTDKKQLDKTIKTIFGEEVNITGYLTKFIDFTVKLPHGDVDQEKFELLFEDYVKNFDGMRACTNINAYDDFWTSLFAYTNIRRQIKIVEKAKLVHSLMPQNTQKLSIDYMAVEIVLTMASFIYDDFAIAHYDHIAAVEDVIDMHSKKEKELWIINQKVFSESSRRYAVLRGEFEDRYVFYVNDIWAMLYYVLLKQVDSGDLGIKYGFQMSNFYEEHLVKEILIYAKQFVETLKIVS